MEEEEHGLGERLGRAVRVIRTGQDLEETLQGLDSACRQFNRA